MYVLILLDEASGRHITWRPESDAQQIEIANALISLDCPNDASEPVEALLHQAS